MTELGGIHPIVYAFFDRFGALDREAMRAQTEACVGFGAHGMAALGLATEVTKLTPAERRLVAQWLAEDVAGRVPFAITVNGATPIEQIEYVRGAEDLGAAWVILQPPAGKTPNEGELIRFFSTVMKATELPCAIQNAPQFLGVGLSDEGLNRLRREAPNFTLLKGEGSALAIGETIAATEGALANFNGRGGLELPDNFRAGCAGLIPAPECADVQVRIWEAMAAGEDAKAEAAIRDALKHVNQKLAFDARDKWKAKTRESRNTEREII